MVAAGTSALITARHTAKPYVTLGPYAGKSQRPAHTMCNAARAGHHRGKPENVPPVDNEIVCNLGNFELCVYNATQDTRVKKPSAPQPTLSLYTTHYPCDTRALGLRTPLRRPTKAALVSVVADTGCQSCLAGTNLLSKLGLTERYLSKTRLQMSAANGNNLDIIGAIALRLSDSASPSDTETRQIVYICRDTSDFLSRRACVALGIVPRNFPGVGQSQQPLAEVSTCSAASESSEQWLLSHYKASTFNTCHHQPLRPMEGPPLRLMVDPDTKPVACHTPIDVPIHWRSDVKAGLDQDCSMGVIEEVPTGTPVTWCHRMVIGAKKNGKPRRTVDLQALNASATRETHHTQRPFHQARSVPHGTKKMVCDAWNGYHAVPLHPDDRHLTTFITPWGRYRYRSASQG